jgi:hypothetical protein
MTPSYLQGLGFVLLQPARFSSPAAFSTAWRYRHELQARDGALLYLEHPEGVPNSRLSHLPAPLAAEDVFATTSLHDRPGLEAAMAAFYAAHGGLGGAAPVFMPFTHRPFRRAE